MNFTLSTLDKNLKNFLTAFLIVLTCGVITGLIYLTSTTMLSPEGTVTRYNGSEVSGEEFEIPENYPKPISEMLVTTHNHVLIFSIIFLSLGSIFYFNTTIKGFWKKFLMIEPFFSTIASFGSLWLMRFVNKNFVYLSVVSAILIYSSLFLMIAVSLYELKFKKL